LTRAGWGALLLLATAFPAAAPAHAQGELFRVRITNQAGGAIELRGDGGQAWEPLGRVVKPATQVNTATEAIKVAPEGAVAAAAPESLTLRLPTAKTGNRTLRILAKGETHSAGAIATDIPGRGSLFRYAAPPIGSPVLVDRGGKNEPLPPGYLPRVGDRLTLLVTPQATAEGTVVTLENKVGGQVELVDPDGIRRAIAKVKQPLRGIGRYAGTERAGTGALLSWSPTAVLVCTAGTARRPDEGEMPAEERGGFVIQPAEPALRGTTHPASQVLIEAVAAEGEPKPAVSPFFGLGAPLSTGDALDPRPTKVEVRIDGGDWEPCPDLRGTLDTDDLPRAVQTAVGRNIRDGITHIRVVIGGLGGPGLARRLKMATVPLSEKVQRGKVNISANVTGEGIVYVQFFLDGALVQLTNRPPYTWSWDTLKTANGDHLIEIRGLNDKLAPVTTVMMRVLVDN
jgi:hypothetical protein